MARRVVDLQMLQGLVENSQTQEVVRGNRKSTDSNFPVFATPLNTDIIVYIPRVNVVSDENGESMRVLNSHVHDYQMGKSFGSMRCISGLSGNALFDTLGYDGVCPACEATRDCWELYREKLSTEASKLGIDPQNDPNDVLKPVRDRILKEMDIKGAEEFVTFPIVVIPTKGKMLPTDDADKTMQVVFVTWRKQRYQDKILSVLESMVDSPEHPAGLFWFWKFSYDTKGKQATVRDSAKNATYTVIENEKVLKSLEPLRNLCEEKSKDFTLVKAAEVIVANQFMYKEDMEVEVDKIMSKTRQLLDVIRLGGNQAQVGQPQVAGALPGGTNPLGNFGVVDNAGTENNMGATNPVKFTE